MTFDETSLEKRLMKVTNTQDGIQSLSLWLLHYKVQYKKIIDAWAKVLEKAKVSHRLTLVNLANDIIQNARKKNIANFVTGFSNVLRQSMVHLRDPSIQPNVLRVLKIWQERNIYGKSFVSELIDTLGGGGIGPSISTIVADFKTQSLVNPILEVTQLEAKTKMSCEPVNQELVKSLTLENLNKLKDKDRSENVIHDCDNTIGLLGNVIQAYEQEVSSRKKLIEQLEKSQIALESQRQDASEIAEAYKKLESRVVLVKQKMKSLPSPLRGSNSSQNGATAPRNSAEHQSSLDQRLSSLMQGIARGNPVDLNALASMASQSGSSVPMSQQQMQNVLNARPPPTSSSQVYAQSSSNSIALESIRLPSEPPRRPIAFQQIESVVSSRAPGNPFDILNTSQQSGESFEPTDMDLGHSDEDDGHAYVPRERAANQNLRVIETQSTYRPNNHNPHQQSTDYPNQETRNDDWRNRPRSVINRGDGYQPELEAVPLNASRQGGQRGRPRPNQMGHRKGNYSRY